MRRNPQCNLTAGARLGILKIGKSCIDSLATKAIIDRSHAKHYGFADLPALQAHAAGRRGYEFVINNDFNDNLQAEWDDPSIIKRLVGWSDEKPHETK